MSMGSGLQADQRAVAPVAAWGRRERHWGPRFSKLIATRGQGRMKEKKLRGQLISNKKETYLENSDGTRALPCTGNGGVQWHLKGEITNSKFLWLNQAITTEISPDKKFKGVKINWKEGEGRQKGFSHVRRDQWTWGIYMRNFKPLFLAWAWKN